LPGVGGAIAASDEIVPVAPASVSAAAA
jgi:hypothetical protein